MSLTRIYRKIVPEKIRKSMYKAFVKGLLDIADYVKHKTYYVVFSIIPPKSEKAACYYFMGKYSAVNYPYAYYFEYIKKDIEVLVDAANGLPYVIHNNKRLYFKKAMNKQKVIDAYRMLLLEQDTRSAHCYVENYEALKGKTIIDAGAAEGIFSLNAIDYANHIYLFECEKDWIEPLKATFEPMKDKITIVEKYVSNVSEGNNVTLDDFFNEKPTDSLFLKMDIEGHERNALYGCQKLLNTDNRMQGAICTYHREDDEKVISAILLNANRTLNKTVGYIYNERMLRTGVLRFE